MGLDSLQKMITVIYGSKNKINNQIKFLEHLVTEKNLRVKALTEGLEIWLDASDESSMTRLDNCLKMEMLNRFQLYKSL